MNLPDLPEEVRAFLDASIDSVEQLEVLLLLWRARPRRLAPAAITLALGSSPESIARRLAGLAAHGLVERSVEVSAQGVAETHAYRDDARRAGLIELLGATYRLRRVSVITYLAARPAPGLRPR